MLLGWSYRYDGMEGVGRGTEGEVPLINVETAVDGLAMIYSVMELVIGV